MLSIKEVSLSDPALIEESTRIVAAVASHDLPGFPPLTPRMARLWLKYPRAGHKSEHYVAFRDGEAVARLELHYTLLDNLKSAYIEVEVHPGHRRRGIGRELYEIGLEKVRAEGRSIVMTRSVWALPGIEAHDGGAGPAFAEAVGLNNANLPEIMRRLDLSTVDSAAIDAMYANAQAKSAGYKLVQWIDRAPDEYVDDVAYLDSRLLQDAPTGDLAIEPEKVDAARIRSGEESHKARGRTAYGTGAVHEETNKLVAYTIIATEPEVPWHSWQYITIVDPDHRGHRLGALVKVANLRLVQENNPSLKVVDTGNAAENSYMISINEEMGFQPMWAFQSWQRDL